jgi:DNA repair photolyase
VQELARAGVPVRVAIAQVMPGLTDSESQLRDLIQAITDHGGEVGFFQTFKMYADTRKTLFAWLEREQPHLLPWYRRVYAAGSYAPRAYERKLAARIARLRKEITPSASVSPVQPMPAGQLSLGLFTDDSIEPARAGEIPELTS